jgi:hypothetical protein
MPVFANEERKTRNHCPVRSWFDSNARPFAFTPVSKADITDNDEERAQSPIIYFEGKRILLLSLD